MGVILFGANDSEEYGILVSEKKIHTIPARDQTLYSVPGRNGDIVFDNGRYQNITVSYTCYCKDLCSRMADIKAWLCQSGYMMLIDSYDPFYYREAVFANNVSVDELLNNVGQFELVFNCKPYRRQIFGSLKKTLTSANTITNYELFESLPKIKITGSGAVTLHINERSYAFTNIPEYLEIDSDLMSCYKDNTLHNDKIKFTEFPVLEPGDNNISWTGNVTKVEVTPRWRRL